MSPEARASPEEPGGGPGRESAWEFRVAVALSVVLGVALRIRTLRLPLILDDYLQIAMSTGRGWVERPPWDRSRLVSGIIEENTALVDIGRLPWWTDPRMRIAPFRPLAGLEGAVDYALHGPNPVAAHAVSLAWLAVAILSASTLFRTAFSMRAAALATVAYALSRSHGVVLVWIANRCAILSAVFVALALHGHIRFREHGERRRRWQTLLCLSLALLSSEYALGAYGFLAAYELVERRDPLAVRGRSLIGPLIVLGVYAVAFRTLGYGARSTTLYADPLAMPARFFETVLRNWPELLCLAFAPVRADLSPRVMTALGASSALLLGLLLFRRSAGSASRRARWFFVGSLLALVPVSVTFPQYRLLPVAELGIAASVGGLVADVIAGATLSNRLAAGFLAVQHFVLSPVATTSDLGDLVLHDFFVYASLTAPLPPDADVDAVVLESTQVFALHYPPLVRQFAGLSVPRTWRVLSCTPFPVEVRRVSDTELELRSLGRSLLDDPQAGVYREPSVPLPSSLSLARGSFRVEILESGSAGPTKIRFGFDRSLDDPSVALLTTAPTGFRRLSLPIDAAPLVIPGG